MRHTKLRNLLAAGAVGMACASPAHACGLEPYIGEVCLFAFDYCPKGYLPADGSLQPVNQYQPLFALLYTTYGGNGTTNFALPDLRGRTPVGIGQGVGLSNVAQGQTGGVENVTLTISTLPIHTHIATVSNVVAASTGQSAPSGKHAASAGSRSVDYVASTVLPKKEGGTGIADSLIVTNAPTGNSLPVPIRNPYLGLRYCIAYTGIWPPRE